MADRRLAILALAVVLVAACGGTSSPPATAGVSTQATRPPGGGCVRAAIADRESSVTGPNAVLFGTAFKPPTEVTPGGTLIVGAYATGGGDLNPFYTLTLANVEAISPVLRGLVRRHLGRQVHPGPGRIRSID